MKFDPSARRSSVTGKRDFPNPNPDPKSASSSTTSAVQANMPATPVLTNEPVVVHVQKGPLSDLDASDYFSRTPDKAVEQLDLQLPALKAQADQAQVNLRRLAEVRSFMEEFGRDVVSQLAEIVSAVEGAIDAEPAVGGHYYDLAKLALYLHQPEKAVAIYDYCLRLNPTKLVLNELALNVHQPDKAVAKYEYSLKDNPLRLNPDWFCALEGLAHAKWQLAAKAQVLHPSRALELRHEALETCAALSQDFINGEEDLYVSMLIGHRGLEAAWQKLEHETTSPWHVVVSHARNYRTNPVQTNADLEAEAARKPSEVGEFLRLNYAVVTGQIEKVYELLETLIYADTPEPMLRALALPIYDPLREMPQFLDALSRMGLTVETLKRTALNVPAVCRLHSPSAGLTSSATATTSSIAETS